jgi:CheY-like chemotaxis protein
MKKLLIADDEKEIRELLKEKLEKNGYQVVAASSGREAVELAKAGAFDIILLDVAMPQMDGYEACKMIKADNKNKDVPVLFLTGKDLNPKSLSERNQELGACGYIAKPSTLKELLEAIKELTE